MKNTNAVRAWAYWIILGIIIVSLYLYFQSQKEEVSPIPTEDIMQTTPKTDEGTTEPTTKTPEPTTKPATIPTQLNLDAPFYTQAPFSDWGYPWQEACEEASILLAVNVYGKHNWTRTEFNDQILKMVEWEKKQFGTYLDTTVAQNAKILDEYLGFKSIVHEDPTLDDIKNILSKGHFIIMFLAGKELNNPNFTNGGPVYHAILVK